MTLIVAHLLFFPVYQTNDDVLMDLIARGYSPAGEPSGELVHINIVLGSMLAGLYSLAPGVPWYRLVMLVIQLGAGIVVVRAVTSWRSARPTSLLILVYFAVFELSFYVRPQFTVTAALAAIAAMTLWLSRTADGRSLSRRSLAVFWALLACAVLVRMESCALVLLVCAPVVAWQAWLAWSAGGGRALRQKLLLPFGGCLLGCGLLVGIHHHHYWSQPEWHDYLEIMPLVSPLVHEQAQDEGTLSACAAVGWTPGDLRVLTSRFFLDPTVFDRTRIRSVAAAFAASSQTVSAAVRHIEVLGKRYFSVLRTRAFLAFALILALYMPTRARALGYLLCLGWAIAIAAGVMASQHRFPDRVGDPLLAAVVALGLSLADRTAGSRGLRSLRVLALAIPVSLAVVTASELHSRAPGARELDIGLRRQLRELSSTHDQILVIRTEHLPLGSLAPLGSRNEFQGLAMLWIGWPTRTPMTFRQLNRLGINDLFASLYTREDVWLIADSRLVELIIGYVREHHGRSIGVRGVRRFDAESTGHRFFTAYQLGPVGDHSQANRAASGT